MTAETDLLPLPEWMRNYTIPTDGFECGKDVMLVDRMHDYARANVAHATAPLQAKVEALRGALKEIRSLSSIDLVMGSDPFDLTAMLGEIHQIADAALDQEGGR